MDFAKVAVSSDANVVKEEQRKAEMVAALARYETPEDFSDLAGELAGGGAIAVVEKKAAAASATIVKNRGLAEVMRQAIAKQDATIAAARKAAIVEICKQAGPELWQHIDRIIAASNAAGLAKLEYERWLGKLLAACEGDLPIGLPVIAVPYEGATAHWQDIVREQKANWQARQK